MKKIIIASIILIVVTLILSGCNKQIIDWNYKFDRAMVMLPDGSVISGKCDSWRDYEDGDQLQVRIDGKTYLTHATNVVLIDN